MSAAVKLEEVGAAKKLPVGFLRENGLEDHPCSCGVVIRYADEHGKQHERVRLRTMLWAKDRSDWTGPSEVKPKASAYDLINRNEIPSIRLAGRGGRGLLRVPADALQRMIADRIVVAPRDER